MASFDFVEEFTQKTLSKEDEAEIKVGAFKKLQIKFAKYLKENFVDFGHDVDERLSAYQELSQNDKEILLSHFREERELLKEVKPIWEENQKIRTNDFLEKELEPCDKIQALLNTVDKTITTELG